MKMHLKKVLFQLTDVFFFFLMRAGCLSVARSLSGELFATK